MARAPHTLLVIESVGERRRFEAKARRVGVVQPHHKGSGAVLGVQQLSRATPPWLGGHGRFASQKQTLVELLTTTVSALLSTFAPGVHPGECAVELAVDYDPQQTPIPNCVKVCR